MSLSDTGSVRRSYADGEIVFHQREAADHLYFVLRGKVRIRKEGDIVDTVIAEFEEGEIFGEMALIDHRPHSATAQAVGETEIATYDKEAFLDALADDPELALVVIGSLVVRLRDTTEQLQKFCTQYVLDRTEIALIERAVLHNDPI